jgi:hypothetical protein
MIAQFMLEILVFCEHVFALTKTTWEATKQATRLWLGPGPTDFLLVPETDIVFPASFQHPPINGLQLYVAETQHIRDHVGSSADAVSRKRLPWLNVVYQNGSQTVDISDWLSGIRWASQEPSLLQILRLYSLSHGVFLAEEAGATVDVITRGGEEESWRFVGSAGIEKV